MSDGVPSPADSGSLIHNPGKYDDRIPRRVDYRPYHRVFNVGFRITCYQRTDF